MNRGVCFVTAAVGAALMVGAAAAGETAHGDAATAALINTKCGGCHEREPDGTLARIGAIRKSPEGWNLTLRRMQQWHLVALSDAEQAALLKHFADTQGLAPEEAAPFRAVLERRPGTIERADDPEVATYCARCHSYARVGLQRRDASEWLKLVHTHVGQFPTLEYQASSRDREWWRIATTELPERLGRKWPLVTASWAAWQGHASPDLTGTWRVAGHRPGKGDYNGTLVVERTGVDRYAVHHRLVMADGAALDGDGDSIVYTGYEWRGSATLGGLDVREVFEVSADGSQLRGRWFAGDAVTGGDLTAVRGGPAILAVQPPYLKTGQKARLTIVGSGLGIGNGLGGAVDLGPGVQVQTIEQASAESVTVLAVADAAAATGGHDVAVGTARLAGGLVVYDRLGSVRIEPGYDIARVGDNGGPVALVPAQFEAVAYLDGATGKPGEVRIGVLPASWSIADYDADAKQAEDAKFGGHIDQNGLFTPSGAGPNPARRGANNAANLSVTAVVTDGAVPLQGTAHLIVTLQRWNDAPVR
jgi:quinohemoprotein amine dehydrogenase